MFKKLPSEVIALIYNYDITFRSIFNLCIKEMISFFYNNRTINMLNCLNDYYKIYNKVNKSHTNKLNYLNYIKELKTDLRTKNILCNINVIEDVWQHYRFKNKNRIYGKFVFPNNK